MFNTYFNMHYKKQSKKPMILKDIIVQDDYVRGYNNCKVLMDD